MQSFQRTSNQLYEILVKSLYSIAKKYNIMMPWIQNIAIFEQASVNHVEVSFSIGIQ